MSTFVPTPEERGPEPVKEVLSRLFFVRGWGRTSEQARLETAWAAAAGTEWHSHTRGVSLRRGVLEVSVSDALVHQHLIMLKSELLQVMQNHVGPIVKDIRFKVRA